MEQLKKRAADLRGELGRTVTRAELEKKLELCGYKVLYYSDDAASKGNQMLELLGFGDDIVTRQAFTFPGGDGCDFVFMDQSLDEETAALALLREWCHIRLGHPVTNRVLGNDFHSTQEASCLADAMLKIRYPNASWLIPACGAMLFILMLLVLQLSGAGRDSNSDTQTQPLHSASVTPQNVAEESMPLADDERVCISKTKFHRPTCTYATDVTVTREQAVANGYGRCQICLP